MSEHPPAVEVHQIHGNIVIQDNTRGYKFERLTPSDTHEAGLQGEMPYFVYVGTPGPKHYVDGKDLSAVPTEYLDYLHNRDDVTLLDNVDGGRVRIGCPEVSESYLDLSEATVVDGEDGYVEDPEADLEENDA